MAAFYNENDPFAAAWLRELIKAGHIATGIVCEKDIRDIVPADLDGFTQCHFFAGIGVWSYALRLAGWPDDRPVWTGSCPCQPFSTAGRAGGFTDERHLWPAFFHLIEHGRPSIVFGEQVASKDGLAWLDLVQADMEGAGYAIGAVDLCAAGVGAPHIRQRLYFVADADDAGSQRRQRAIVRERSDQCAAGASGPPYELADAEGAGGRAHVGAGSRNGGVDCATRDSKTPTGNGCALGVHGCELADADGGNAGAERLQRGGQHGFEPQDGIPLRSGDRGIGHNCGPDLDRPGPTNGIWRDADWLYCRDGKWRPVRPGSFPLAHGAPARVGRLRGYGNAIVAQAAAEFIAAYSGT